MTDHGTKKYFVEVGFQVLKREIFAMKYIHFQILFHLSELRIGKCTLCGQPYILPVFCFKCMDQ